MLEKSWNLKPFKIKNYNIEEEQQQRNHELLTLIIKSS